MTTKGLAPTLTYKQLIARELHRCTPLGAGRVKCGSCCAVFANGYSFLEHFTRLTGDIECADASVMAFAGFLRGPEGWEKG
jgi:hypothetical protein